MAWGSFVFLVLQQRSKHARYMVITPKASTSHYACYLFFRRGRINALAPEYTQA